MVVSVAAFAGDCHPKAHGGFGVGLHGGYVTSDSRYQRTYGPSAFVPNNLGSTDTSARGGVVGLDFSYGYLFENKLFAGLELKADIQGTKGKTSEKNGVTLYE